MSSISDPDSGTDTEADLSPVPQSTIDALPSALISDSSLLCAVCTDPFGSSDARALPCGHAFHTCCIGPWLRRRNSCPLCRNPLYHRRRRRGGDDAERAERAVAVARAWAEMSSVAAGAVASAQAITRAVARLAEEERAGNASEINS